MLENIENIENGINDERCPVEAVAEIIGQKWVSLIIRDLANGPQRFGELQHSIKISPRVLSSRLQELELQGLVTRKVFAEVPPRTEYTLTERGCLLVPLIEEMRRIGHDFI
jgi:DNA-binding HxlR family transcriptional regulator